MRKDKLTVLLIFAVTVIATVGFQLLRGNGSAPTSQSKPPATNSSSRRPVTDSRKVLASMVALKPHVTSGVFLSLLATPEGVPFRGISLGLHSNDPNNPYEKYIDEIAATGANTVSFVIAGYQENVSSTSVFVEWRKTPSERRIKDLITYAHGKSLKVVFMPILLLENPDVGDWRGKIAPTNWDAWWDRYTDYLLHYLRLAEAENVEVFILGSELVSTEKQTDRWGKLIQEARKQYRGLLTYSANWDHYDGIEWWNDLDMIGMNTYHDLKTPEHPTVEQLVEAWKPIKAQILECRSKTGLPLLFTEVGWPNQVTCANAGWNYYAAEDKPDPTAQANCFEAFFRTWMSEKDIAGVLIWEWRNNPKMVGGPKDTSYIPCDKPAQKVIEEYFRIPLPLRRPPTSRPTTQPSPTLNLVQSQPERTH